MTFLRVVRTNGVEAKGGNIAANARRLHSATMTNLIAAFRGLPDNYDDASYARITLIGTVGLVIGRDKK